MYNVFLYYVTRVIKCPFILQARLFDEPQLANLCLDTIDKNTNEAFAADGFTDIDLSTLVAVLERDTLRIREAKLFQAIQRYFHGLFPSSLSHRHSNKILFKVEIEYTMCTLQVG